MNAANLRGMGTRFFRYLRDPHVALWRKLVGVAALVYIISPIDGIPDIIPLLGWLDDMGVLSGGAFFLVRELRQYNPPAEGPPPAGGPPSAGEDRQSLPQR